MAKIQIDKRVCKKCNEPKGRVAMGRFPNGSIRYVDEKKQFWNGRLCPDCNAERIRIAVDVNRKAKEQKSNEGI